MLKRIAEILGNTLRTSAGKTAAVAATPDLLGSLGNLLEHEDEQGREGGRCPRDGLSAFPLSGHRLVLPAYR